MATRVIDTFITEFLFNVDRKQLDSLESRIRRVRSGLNAASTAALAGGVAVTAAFGSTAKAAASWEDAFTGVRKTVEATEEEFLALEETLLEMANTEIPVDPRELAAVAEAAGQLGIAKSNLVDFVSVMAMLGVTTNLTSEDAATMSARFANITKMDQEFFDELGSTIVALGNNFATTEREILQMALRLAGAGEQVGLTEAQILALATSLSSVGIEAEAGGTAFSRVMLDMQEAVETGSEKLDDFARAAGVSPEEFARVFRTDATQAIAIFLDGLKTMEEHGQETATIINELGLSGIRVRDSLLRMKSAQDLMNDALALANAEWVDNAALTKEADLRFATFSSRTQLFKNNIFSLRVAIGNALLPSLNELIETVQPMVADFREWAKENGGVIRGVAILGPGLIGLGIALRAVSWILGAYLPIVRLAGWLTALMGKYAVGTRIALAALAAWTGIVTAAQWLWNIALTANPIGLIVVAIAALVAGIAGLIIYWDEVKEAAKAAWGWILDNVHNIPGFDLVKLQIEAIVWAWDKLVESVSSAWSFLSETLREALPDVVVDWIWGDGGGDVLQELPDGTAAGRAVGAGLSTGLRESSPGVAEAADALAGVVGKRLPSSDAETGPLARLTQSGRSLVDTFAAGILEGSPALAGVLAGALALPATSLVAPVVEMVASIPDIESPVIEAFAGLPDFQPHVPPVERQDARERDGAAAGAGGATTRVYNIRLGDLTVRVQEGDPDRIAGGLVASLKEQLHNVVEDLDSPVQ